MNLRWSILGCWAFCAFRSPRTSASNDQQLPHRSRLFDSASISYRYNTSQKGIHHRGTSKHFLNLLLFIHIFTMLLDYLIEALILKSKSGTSNIFGGHWRIREYKDGMLVHRSFSEILEKLVRKRNFFRCQNGTHQSYTSDFIFLPLVHH